MKKPAIYHYAYQWLGRLGFICCLWAGSHFITGCDTIGELEPIPPKGFIKIYGGANDQTGVDLKATPDGGFIALGTTGSFGSGATDIYLVKTDSVGNAEWVRTFGGPYYDRGVALQLTPNQDGYIILGDWGLNANPDSSKMVLIKVDVAGQEVWPQPLILSQSRKSTEYGADIQLLPNTAGYMVIGTTSAVDSSKNGWNPATDLEDIYVARIAEPATPAEQPRLTFEQQHGFAGLDKGVGVRPFPDGTYDILGNTRRPGETQYKILFNKISVDGIPLISTKIIGGSGEVSAQGWEFDGDNYLVAGSRNISGPTDGYWAILDNQGNVLEQTTLSGAEDDVLSNVIRINGGFLLAGTTESLRRVGKKDFFLRTVPFPAGAPEIWAQDQVLGSTDDDYMGKVIQASGGFVFVGTSGFINNTNLNLTKVNTQGEL